jgi:hypothetical protein
LGGDQGEDALVWLPETDCEHNHSASDRRDRRTATGSSSNELKARRKDDLLTGTTQASRLHALSTPSFYRRRSCSGPTTSADSKRQNVKAHCFPSKGAVRLPTRL